MMQNEATATRFVKKRIRAQWVVGMTHQWVIGMTHMWVLEMTHQGHRDDPQVGPGDAP